MTPSFAYNLIVINDLVYWHNLENFYVLDKVRIAIYKNPIKRLVRVDDQLLMINPQQLKFFNTASYETKTIDVNDHLSTALLDDDVLYLGTNTGNFKIIVDDKMTNHKCSGVVQQILKINSK